MVAVRLRTDAMSSDEDGRRVRIVAQRSLEAVPQILLERRAATSAQSPLEHALLDDRDDERVVVAQRRSGPGFAHALEQHQDAPAR